MARWARVEDEPREFEPSGDGLSASAWAWDLVRDGGERMTVEVVVADFVEAVDVIREDARRAIETKGWSEVELWLDEQTLPPRIVVHTNGASPKPGSA